MNKRTIWLSILLFTVILVGIYAFTIYQGRTELDSFSANLGTQEAQSKFGSIYDTDFSRSSIDLDLLLSGGVGKDGIPALTDPEFTSLANSTVGDEVQGILIKNNNQVKFYPYNILVWHEIVNDKIGGKRVVVTFCPLCGSAAVFNPEVEHTGLAPPDRGGVRQMRHG